MKCLLVDAGSTYIKWAVFETETQTILAQSQTPFPAPEFQEGGRFLVSENALRAVFLQGVQAHPECRSIFISVQMHGYLFKRPGGDFSPYVSWRDASGDVKQPGLAQIDFEVRGTSLKANLPFVKLYRIPWEGELFTLGSYIAWLLTGVNAAHITDLCASGFYDAQTGECFRAEDMPCAFMAVQPVGSYRGARVFAPVGDHQASYLGSGAGESAWLVNIGTATQVSCMGRRSETALNCELRPWFERDRRLFTVSGLMGGSELYQNGWNERLWEQISDAIFRLPRRSRMLLGGGGARQVFEKLQKRCVQAGIECRLLERSIGLEGLKMLAQKQACGRRLGTMLSEAAFPHFPLIAANCGLDFVIIDNEHGAFDDTAMAALCMNARLSGVRAIVRLACSDRGYLTRLADMGAGGVLLPMTNSREDVERVIRCVYYPPMGRRGVSTTRAHTLYNPPALTEYMPAANAAMQVWAQIETAQGLEAVQEILSVNGTTGVLIGPNDLSVDLNCGKEELCRCMERVASAAQQAGKPWGIITTDARLLQQAELLHAEVISYGSELNMLINGCKKIKEMF